MIFVNLDGRKPINFALRGFVCVVFRQRLRSASSHQLSVPRYRLSTYGRRAFSVIAGPTLWNSLPEDLRNPECCADSYRQSLKTFLFSQY